VNEEKLSVSFPQKRKFCIFTALFNARKKTAFFRAFFKLYGSVKLYGRAGRAFAGGRAKKYY